MKEPKESGTDTPARTPDRPGPRWLLSRLFWPGYLLSVAVFLVLVEPWEPWSRATTDSTVSVMIHRNAGFEFQETGNAGIVLMCAEPLPSVPEGWLPCDGGELSVADYPGLFRSLTGHSETAEGDQMFRLPDYRGLVVVLLGEEHRWRMVSSLRVAGSVEDYPTEFQLTAAPLHFFIKTKSTVITRRDDGTWETIEKKR